MKTNTTNKTALLFCILWAMFFTACQQNELEQPADFSIQNATKIINAYNEGKQTYEAAHHKTGSVTFNPIDSRFLEIYLITDEGEYLHYFLPFEEAIQNGFENKEIAAAEVLYFRRQLIVNSTKSSDRLFFKFEKESPIASIKDLEFTKVYHPVGLTWQTNASSGMASTRGDVNCHCCTYTGSVILGTQTYTCGSNEAPSEGSAGCDSGGVGATSCSMTSGNNSCSVSCSANYEACCYDG